MFFDAYRKLFFLVSFKTVLASVVFLHLRQSGHWTHGWKLKDVERSTWSWTPCRHMPRPYCKLSASRVAGSETKAPVPAGPDQLRWDACPPLEFNPNETESPALCVGV
ncbi:hypothetical protein GN956_G7845 [Arapaima gigas]